MAADGYDPADAVVHRARLHVQAHSGLDAVGTLGPAERALRQALGDVAQATGDELIVVEQLDLRLGLRHSGQLGEPEGRLRSAMRSALKERIEEMRARAVQVGTDSATIGGIAWFASTEVALAELLIACLEGRQSEWPYRALAHFGRSWDEVASSTPRPVLGGAIVKLVESLGPSSLGRRLSPAHATALLRRWLGPTGSETGAAGTLPPEVRTKIQAVVTDAAVSVETAQGRLAVLAALFEAWPPARNVDMPEEELSAVAEAPEGETVLQSRAGGLLPWLVLLQERGLWRRLAAAYGDPRARAAARWAVGRALSQGGLSENDPLLLWWSGESVEARIAPAGALRESDPESLHREAIAAAVEDELIDTSLRIRALGDSAVVMCGDLCIDALRGADVHAVVPDAVSRFTSRAGAPPPGVTVESEPSDSRDIDALTEVDVPALPERWRIAVRAFASVARRLAGNEWGVQMRDLHGWRARVESGRPLRVHLPRRLVKGVGEGRWADSDLTVEGRACSVVPTNHK